MLDIARHRNTHLNVSFVNRDMGSLEIVSESVDIVTGSYALRNAPDLGTAIDEISRGLKIWTGLWGLLLHRNHEVYSYIAESLQRFPDRHHLRNIFRERGLSVINSRLFFFGIAELLVVQKIGR